MTSILPHLLAWAALSGSAAETPPAEDPGTWAPVRRARLTAALQRLAPGTPVLRLRDFPGRNGRPVELLLTRITAMAPGSTARVVEADGRERRLAPSIEVFSVAYRADGTRGHGHVAWSPAGLVGEIRDDGGRPLLAPAPGARPLPRHDGLGAAWSCDVTSLGADDPQDDWGEGPLALRAAGGALQVGELFVEGDLEYRALFDTSQEAVDYAVLLVSVVSDIYRRDLGIELSLPDGHLRVWNTTPPWGTYQGTQDFDDFRNWWQSPSNPLAGEERANVHLLTGPPWGGISGAVTGVCLTKYAYGVSGVIRSYVGPPQHTGRENWDVFVLAHELGHSFGSLHAEDYSPPIECGDGTGPDLGTIMSTCHLVTGNVREIGMRFHPRVQDKIRSTVASKPCFTDRPYDAGDWNVDGALDGADLAALDACLAQGFDSAGCFDTFDFDGDGLLGPEDRDELVRRAGLSPPDLVPYGCRNPAGSLVHLGGTPRVGSTVFLGVDNPLGTQTPGSRALLLLALAPDPRYPCGAGLRDFGMSGNTGELLVALSTRVGSPIVGAAWTGPGQPAAVALAIPDDPAYVGLRLFAQGMLYDPFGPRRYGLANAVDVTIGL